MTRKEGDTPAWMRSANRWDKKPTLLFVDYEVPRYDLYAGSRTNFMYLEMLAKMELDVKFLAEDFRRAEPYSSELNQLGIETLDGDWYRQNWERWLQENGRSIDFVFLHKPDPASKFLPAVKKWTSAAVIYQCHDLHHLRLKRKAEVDPDPAILEEALRYEETENYLFANSDAILTFSETEEQLIRENFPHKPVFTVPLFFYREAGVPRRDFRQRKDLLYVGSCSHSPNRDAIAWFCREIFPLVQRQLPGVNFNVVGADPPPEIAALDSKHIRILGRLSEEELTAQYAAARMMVVPLRFGAGVKGKIIEALHHGVPLVSTGVGLEGIKGIYQLAAPQDSPEDFAAAVVALYSDPDSLYQLSLRGSRFVAENFSADRAVKLMTRVLSAAQEQACVEAAEAAPGAAHATSARLIAFYLPQYHPIPENDEWWGQGFTEWKNVSRARPLFPGHYQPHVPAELGYYDLRHEETRDAQAELARKYGIEGFCYYHYWFNGRRLLERPLQEVLESGKPDFPFCLCWANENWTRRWDGKDQQILMRQEYSEEDDLRHIRSLLPVFADRRYIRINGKPLFLVYRTENMPDPARTARVWREQARAAGLGELHLCRVESFGKCDPAEINFDSALEFAPDWWNKGPRLKGGQADAAAAGAGQRAVFEDNYVHYYQSLVDSMMAKEAPGYKWMRCVTPSWDNAARMKKGATIFHDSSPEKYGEWLAYALFSTNARLSGEERLVFINAWNEWAEGNHLEPDQRHGHAYLEETLKTLEESRTVLQADQQGAPDGARMSQLMNQLVNHKYRLKELERRVANREQRIEELLNSTSWRLTLPVRWAKRQILKIRNRLPG